MKIFVQIASYRDPQLVPTIKDMLANAKRPKNLVLGISRQFSESDGFDNLDEFRSDKRFKILDIPYQEAQGVCWARHLVQQYTRIFLIFSQRSNRTKTVWTIMTFLYFTIHTK